MILQKKQTHPKGEQQITYGGRVHVEWDPNATVTPLGQLPFFIEHGFSRQNTHQNPNLKLKSNHYFKTLQQQSFFV